MSFFDNRYYYLNKRFLVLIGQWPFQSRLESNMMFAITSLFIYSLIGFEMWGLAAGITDLSIIMENVSQLLVESVIVIKLVTCVFTNNKTWGLVAGITDLNIIMENASPLLVDCFMMLKLMNCVLTNNKIKELLKDVEETWKIKPTGPEKEILQHHAEKSKIFAIRYAIHVPIALDTMYTLCIQHICALFECLRYSCNWYKISMRSKDLLRFTLLRATKSCQIKAGKLFIMSMENFSSMWGLAAGITDLSIIMENVSQLLVESVIVIKLVTCVFTNNKLQMKELLEDIEETWKIKHTNSEKKILQHYAEKSRTFTIRYAIILQMEMREQPIECITDVTKRCLFTWANFPWHIDGSVIHS
ncbi:PREDICTED: uncharacterized protein LOC108690297 [Atta colombica]|uniref:uncharacterized protein LOC108690297 n=1 Tax=Atta colombica TaxID=520822 RepID=UPI00084C9785|nr:PREDICTED: uncharacterized protein LOC108690297 [Atta colombica]